MRSSCSRTWPSGKPKTFGTFRGRRRWSYVIETIQTWLFASKWKKSRTSGRWIGIMMHSMPIKLSKEWIISRTQSVSEIKNVNKSKMTISKIWTIRSRLTSSGKSITFWWLSMSDASMTRLLRLTRHTRQMKLRIKVEFHDLEIITWTSNRNISVKPLEVILPHWVPNKTRVIDWRDLTLTRSRLCLRRISLVDQTVP